MTDYEQIARDYEHGDLVRAHRPSQLGPGTFKVQALSEAGVYLYDPNQTRQWRTYWLCRYEDIIERVLP